MWGNIIIFLILKRLLLCLLTWARIKWGGTHERLELQEASSPCSLPPPHSPIRQDPIHFLWENFSHPFIPVRIHYSLFCAHFYYFPTCIHTFLTDLVSSDRKWVSWGSILGFLMMSSMMTHVWYCSKDVKCLSISVVTCSRCLYRHVM